MALTRDIANELTEALNEQMDRCPGCHGAGKVRQSGDYQPCFCLVCEDSARALYICEKHDSMHLADLSNQGVLESLRPHYEQVVKAAREFVKRCPGCFGIGKVWSGAQQRKCLVCHRLRKVIAAYDDVTVADDITPLTLAKQGRRRVPQ